MADNNQLLDHDYDGIKEYDNPLPNWWLTTFYGAIIFAFIYTIHYEFGGGWTQSKELAEDMSHYKALQQAAAQSKSSEPAESEEQLMAMMSKAENLTLGKEVYVAKCAACHGDQGQGLVGPNLADNFWIHGKGTRADILKVVRTGVADKGMPPWENMLKTEEVMAVAGYAFSLKGTSPANPKAPQGAEVN